MSYIDTGIAEVSSYDTHHNTEHHGGYTSGYGGHGGHGGHGHGGYGKLECCPLVVDPLTVAALLGTLGLATMILNALISASLGRRKKRSDGSFVEVQTGGMWFLDLFHHGRKFV